MKALSRFAVVLAGLALAAALLFALVQLPPAAVDLPAQVAAHLGQSGVEHPVTAVLLNFRGYDTLLEVAVLLLALLTLLTVHGRLPNPDLESRAGHERAPLPQPHPPREGEASGAAGDSSAVAGAGDPLLQGLARWALPLIILTAGYLLWAGAHRPGGAFQAGAVLAAGAVLLQLTGLLPAWAEPRRLLRLGLVLGFLVFLAVTAALLGEGAMLRYPPASAGGLILLIEAGLTLSLGLILAGLFLFVTGRR
jgi:multisubunit Na+/H+ antiporter MnhB subunit